MHLKNGERDKISDCMYLPGHSNRYALLVSETLYCFLISLRTELSPVLRSLSWSASKQQEYINLSS